MSYPSLGEEVRQRVLKMFANEDPKNPVSDQKVADALAKKGIKISRRCVAKYRLQFKFKNYWRRRIGIPAAMIMTLVAACCGPQRVDGDRAERQRIAELEDRTVHVTLDCGGWGSGFMLGSYRNGTLIATAAHVVDDALCGYRVRGHEAEVLSIDTKHDVALIWISRYEYRPQVRQGQPYLGQELWAAGYPNSRLTEEAVLTVTSGVLVSEVSGLYRVSNIVFFGSSGGGVVDREGRLVGVVSSMISGSSFNAPAEIFIAPAKHVFNLVSHL